MIGRKKYTAAKIALILPSAGDARKALDVALKYLAPDGELWIVQTPGGLVPSAVSTWMIYLGFMGDRPSGDYMEIAMEEYRSRVQERLDDLTSIAHDRKVECSPVMLEGKTEDAVLEWVQEHQPDGIVVLRPEIIDPERELFIKLADLLEKRFSVKLYRV